MPWFALATSTCRACGNPWSVLHRNIAAVAVLPAGAGLAVPLARRAIGRLSSLAVSVARVESLSQAMISPTGLRQILLVVARWHFHPHPNHSAHSKPTAPESAIEKPHNSVFCDSTRNDMHIFAETDVWCAALSQKRTFFGFLNCCGWHLHWACC